MIVMVCFLVDGGAYCMPVTSTRSVRRITGLTTLPGAGRDVIGMIPGEPSLTVIAALGGRGEHVLVVESAGQTFGLQVDEVTGLRRVEPADIQPAPAGQNRDLISGTIDTDGRLVLVTDPRALAERL